MCFALFISGLMVGLGIMAGINYYWCKKYNVDWPPGSGLR